MPVWIILSWQCRLQGLTAIMRHESCSCLGTYLAAAEPMGLETRFWVLCCCVQRIGSGHVVPMQQSWNTKRPMAVNVLCQRAQDQQTQEWAMIHGAGPCSANIQVDVCIKFSGRSLPVLPPFYDPWLPCRSLFVEQPSLNYSSQCRRSAIASS